MKKSIVLIGLVFSFVLHAQQVNNYYDVVVVGDGMAGLTAAMYTVRANYKTLVIGTGESQLIGSMLVENMPAVEAQPGFQIIEKLRCQAESFGAQCYYGHVFGIEKSNNNFVIHVDDDTEYLSRAVIIATGSTPRRLHIDNEELLWMKSIFTCAVCDGRIARDKDVVVIGGGQTAIADACYLASCAKSVTIVVRSGSMRAAKISQDLLQKFSNIKVVYHCQPQAFSVISDSNGESVLSGLVCYDDVSVAPVTIPCHVAFLAIGHTPNKDCCKDFFHDSSTPGIFMAGDVIDERYRQACIAAGSGAMAGLDCIAYLNQVL